MVPLQNIHKLCLCSSALSSFVQFCSFRLSSIFISHPFPRSITDSLTDCHTSVTRRVPRRRDPLVCYASIGQCGVDVWPLVYQIEAFKINIYFPDDHYIYYIGN